MAVVVFSDVPGGTAEQDGAVMQQMGVAANPPTGILARLAGPTEGGWRVISVWASQESWDAFRRDRLEPTIQQMGRPMPQFTIWPLHSAIIQGQRV